MASKKQINSFIETIAPKVIEICNSKSRKILPSVCIAQACYESSYGTSQKMIKANALFGIKVGSSKVKFGTAWKGAAYSTKTKEYYDGKTRTDITDMFRAYDSIKDSIEDYYDMLGNTNRYKNCIGVTNPKKCITEIKNAGYATDPKYIDTVVSIIKSNNLTKYDTCMTKINKSETSAVEIVTNTKFKLGEKVKVSAYYKNSTTKLGKISKTKLGVISKIIPEANNPYCISSTDSVAIGWTNDKYLSVGSYSTLSITVTHKVKSGDTLSGISKKYGIPVSTIVNRNKTKYPSISASFIRVGWELKIK